MQYVIVMKFGAKDKHNNKNTNAPKKSGSDALIKICDTTFDLLNLTEFCPIYMPDSGKAIYLKVVSATFLLVCFFKSKREHFWY